MEVSVGGKCKSIIMSLKYETMIILQAMLKRNEGKMSFLY
jgi:hypothetical protein